MASVSHLWWLDEIRLSVVRTLRVSAATCLLRGLESGESERPGGRPGRVARVRRVFYEWRLRSQSAEPAAARIGSTPARPLPTPVAGRPPGAAGAGPPNFVPLTAAAYFAGKDPALDAVFMLIDRAKK